MPPPADPFAVVARPLTAEELALRQAISDKASELACVILQVNPSRARSVAMTELETAILWAHKAITG